MVHALPGYRMAERPQVNVRSHIDVSQGDRELVVLLTVLVF